jgi:organic hydroperoxide reductase OsmC/OhrA
MSEHTIALEWHRDTEDFNYDSYSRNHVITFGDVGKVRASASPEYHGDPHCLDPEQAFVMSLSSCHMLTFLAIASKKGFVVDAYSDKAVGTLGKNQSGKWSVTKVTLRPIAVFSGVQIPNEEEFRGLHQRAHSGCIIANSVASCVELVIESTMKRAS